LKLKTFTRQIRGTYIQQNDISCELTCNDDGWIMEPVFNTV